MTRHAFKKRETARWTLFSQIANVLSFAMKRQTEPSAEIICFATQILFTIQGQYATYNR
jgi:hypothetical protein